MEVFSGCDGEPSSSATEHNPLDGMCRICAEKCQDLVNIFESEGRRMQLQYKINTSLPVLVQENDYLPLSVCRSCITRIEQTYELNTLCQKAEIKLNDLYHKTKEKINNSTHEYKLPRKIEEYLIPTEIPLNTGPSKESYTHQGIPNNTEQRKFNCGECLVGFPTPQAAATHCEQAQKSVVMPTLVIMQTKPSTSTNLKPFEHVVVSPAVSASKVTTTGSSNPSTSLKPFQHVVISPIVSNTKVTKSNNKPSTSTNVEPFEHIFVTPKLEPEDFPEDFTNDEYTVPTFENPIAFSPNIRKLFCKSCNAAFNNEEQVMNHCVEFHLECLSDKNFSIPSTFQCPICHNENYLKRSEVVNHCFISHKKFLCEICFSSFGAYDDLSQHSESVHVINNAQSNNQRIPTKEIQTKISLCESTDKSMSNKLTVKSVKQIDQEYKNKRMVENKNKQGENNSCKNQWVLEDENKLDTIPTWSNDDTSNKLTVSKVILPTPKLLFEASLQDMTCDKSDDAIIKCLACGSKCSKDNIQVHYKKKHGRTVCPYCYKFYGYVRDTKQHCLDIHETPLRKSKERVYICETCGKVYTKSDSFKYHVMTHTEESNQFTCNYCSKKFCHEKPYKAHMLRHSGKKQVECQLCDKTFFTTRSLRVHMDVHNEQKYICNICGTRFKARNSLTAHMQKQHETKWIYHCSICEFTLESEDAILAHYSKHTGLDKSRNTSGVLYHRTSPFECQICVKYWGSKLSYQLHMRRRHGLKAKDIENQEKIKNVLSSEMQTLKTFECNDCYKTFVTKFQIQAHVGVHMKVKPFECMKCSKSFCTKMQLNIHNKSHT